MNKYTLHDKDVRKSCIIAIEKLPEGKLWEVSISEHKTKRSMAQNSLYWLWMTEIADQATTSDGQYLEKEEWHYMCALKFLGVNKLSVAGNEYKLPVKSTKDLTVGEFSEYLLEIESEFLSREVMLTFPRDYGLATGQQ